MNAERSSMWLSVLANFGVLVGLILLVMEIRHNTASTQAVLYEENISLGVELAGLLLSDENRELAEIVFRGQADPDSLSGIELQKFILYTSWRMAPWESAFIHHDEGLLSERHWKNVDTGISVFIQSEPGFRRWWDTVGYSYDPKFQAHVNKLFEELREE
jgi:hypothetical protein